MLTISSLITWVLVPLALALLSTTIVITRQQHVRMIETFGKFSHVASAGLSFKLPWPIQMSTTDFSLKLLEIAEEVNVKSSDDAFLCVPIRVQFCVEANNAKDAFYKLDNPYDQIRSYVVNQVRATASGMTFNELFQARTTFEEGVEATLKGRMAEFGFNIENVLVDDPQPSDDLRKAFDRVISSKRLKEAAVNEGEAARTLAVAKATAEGESLKIKGVAYAEFRKTVAEGNADALEAFSGKTGLTAVAGLEFFTSINEMEAVRDAADAGAQIVFVTGSASAKSTNDPVLMGMIAANADRQNKSADPLSVSVTNTKLVPKPSKPK